MKQVIGMLFSENYIVMISFIQHLRLMMMAEHKLSNKKNVTYVTSSLISWVHAPVQIED